MKKKLPIILMTGFLALSLGSLMTACGGNDDNGGGGGGGGGGVTDPVSQVESVKISGADATKVFDGSTTRLTAAVTPSTVSQKVTWKSSDENVATVVNGTVSFKTVSENKNVTITATSKEDDKKSDSVTFTVVHGIVDLANSRGTLDTSLFMDEGTITAEVGDTAVILSDVNSTRWYVEASITVDALSDTDNYPKLGIMTSTRSDGYWNAADNKAQNGFFYVDSQKAGESSGWTNFNFVVSNEEMVDWNWAAQLGGFNVPNDKKVTEGGAFKMGLLRDGINYQLYVGSESDETLTCFKALKWTGIPADVPSYAWFGGWSSGITVGNIKALTGDKVDTIFGTPTTLDLSTNEMIVYINETYQINATLDVNNYDPSKLTFASSDESVATVDRNGLVTASGTAGTCTITVTYGTLSQQLNFEVSDDPNLRVVLDGNMDDGIWSDTVKSNKYTLTWDENNYIDFYGSRNSQGVYIFADYYCQNLKHNNDNWWENDNFELRFGTFDNVHRDLQLWASAIKQSNFSDAFISSIETTSSGLNHLTFETFTAYDKEELAVSKDDIVTVRFGSNSQIGWKASSWWESSSFEDYLKVTKDGLVKYLDPSVLCSEGHTYKAYHTTLEATCATDGIEAHECKYCNHSETRPIPKGAHQYDPKDVTVVTPSTSCSEHGSGTVTCTVCNQLVTVPTPTAHNNHSTLVGGECPGCHGAANFNYPAGTNWKTRNYQLAVMDGATDFSVTSVIDMVRTNGDNDAARGWAGQIQCADNESSFNDADANKFVWRQDWWGWGHYCPAYGNAEYNESTENRDGNCGGWNEAVTFDQYKGVVLDDCELTQTISYVAATRVFSIVTHVKPNAEGLTDKDIVATYTSLPFPAGKVFELGFGMLWNMEGYHNVKSVKIDSGTVLKYAQTHDGTVGYKDAV